jgi:hypothetical protein
MSEKHIFEEKKNNLMTLGYFWCNLIDFVVSYSDIMGLF